MLKLVSNWEIGRCSVPEIEPVKKELVEWRTPFLASCLVGRMFPLEVGNPISVEVIFAARI